MLSLREFIQRNISSKLQEKLENIGISLVLEMAQVNKKDGSTSYFPSNKYKLYIYIDDHLPAHFHIISNQEGFDIRVDCITGDLISVKKYGKRKKDSHFTDIIRDVKKWLDEPSANRNYEGKDNRDMVKMIWNDNNDNEI